MGKASGASSNAGGSVPDCGRNGSRTNTITACSTATPTRTAFRAHSRVACTRGLPTAPTIEFRLYPAAPNPVVNRTQVAFDLPRQSLARAALYDISGRLVRVLADETLAAGKHRLEWDRRDESGRQVASGIYFLLLHAGTHQSRQKIVVVS